MSAFSEKIDFCCATREYSASVIEKVLKDNSELSEAQFCDKVLRNLAVSSNIWRTGWYDPPPGGATALFSEKSNYERLQFDTLRNPNYWPSNNRNFTKESVGIIYTSPVHRISGVIGDIGLTLYRGEDKLVQQHIARCLSLLEKVADYAEVGMQFRDIHEYAQNIFSKEGVNNRRTVTHTDPLGTNLGHTIPWSYEDPTPAELSMINGENFEKLKNLISKKRLYINKIETFVIPGDIAFTCEVRLEDSNNKKLPNVFFHLIVVFKDGKKTIHTNFNFIFKLLGMEGYAISKY